MSALAPAELAQIERANDSGRTPVMFIHGLWLLPSSWDRWAKMFDEAGYAPLTPGWPDDPETVERARAMPMLLANKSVGQVADHHAEIASRLTRKPVLVGHSFGGLLTQILAGQGLATASVAIDGAPYRGILALPVSSLRSAMPALGNPLNLKRAVMLTYEQFRYAFANAVSEPQARELYESYSVPGPARPLFQAAAANLNPFTEVKVDTHNPDRGPLMIVSGAEDHVVPWAISKAAYSKQRHNQGATEILEIPARGHSLTIDDGWHEVAEHALEFVKRFA